MLDSQRVTDLAEAVADGRIPDWLAAESSSADSVERGVIGKLRAVQAIGGLYTTCTGGRPDELGRIHLEPGATWGALEIRAHIGRGRFGDVYRAWDPALDREVALKVIRHAGGTESGETRIVEEGRLMARVRHPNVVTIFGAQRLDGVSGIWMELIEGRTLAAELAERGPYSAEELASVGIELGGALAAVHGAGLVHRDVKAQNVLRDRTGRIVLGDFGTGREIDDPEGTHGNLAGTPAYLAPEIFEGQPATPQSDIYSLGALVFHLATRDYPVAGRSFRELRDAHTRVRRSSLAAVRPDLPRALTAAVEKALASSRAGRFQDADAMAGALRAALPHPQRTRRVWAGLAIAATIAIISAVAVLTRTNDPARGALPFAERDWVLIAATENRTENPVFDGALDVAIERELSISRFVNVIPRGRVADTLRLMRKPASAPLDRTTSQEVAVRDGDVRAILAGRIDHEGQQSYRVTVDLLAPADGVTVASFSERAVGASMVADAIRKISFNLRQQLGESLRAIDASRVELARVTTPSLRALQLYSHAVAMDIDEGPPPDKLGTVAALLDEALREDPDFVSAHMKLSIVRRLQNNLADSLAHIERAVALGETATEVERLVSTAELYGVQAFMENDLAERRRLFEQSAATYEAVRRIHPDDHQTLICLTNLYLYGIFLGRPNLEVASALASLRPNSARWRMAAVKAALADGRLDLAREMVERPLPTPHDSETAHWVAALRIFRVHDAWLRNQPHEALALADTVAAELDGMPRTIASRHARMLVDVYLTLGALARAESLLARIDGFPRRFDGLRIAVERRDPSALRRLLARDYASLEDVAAVSSTLIDSGQLSRARQALEILKRRRAQPFTTLVEGQLAVAEGRLDDGIRLLSQYRDLNPIHARATVALAQALARRGRADQAVAVLQETSARRLEFVGEAVSNGFAWLSVRDALAQIYHQTGRIGDAKAIDDELHVLLAVADHDHPIKRRLTAQAVETSQDDRKH